MKRVLGCRIYPLINIKSFRKKEGIILPILPSFRVRLFVAVPEGNLSHFQDPTLSYLNGSPDDELAWAKSTVTRTCVSTRDLVPPSGMLGTMIGRLRMNWLVGFLRRVAANTQLVAGLFRREYKLLKSGERISLAGACGRGWDRFRKGEREVRRDKRFGCVHTLRRGLQHRRVDIRAQFGLRGHGA
jgi:hypothetical protein